MRFEQPFETAGAASGSQSWADIAAGAWQADSRRITSPARETSSRSDIWVLPIGANSDDKKKDVPLEQIDKPDPRLPKPYDHPPATRMDGKCGITGVCNLLRLYDVEKQPGDIDTSEYRSYGPGLRTAKFASNMRELSGKNFESRSIEDGSDPLDTLRNHIKEGRPVAIQYMTSATNAHWVVVTGINDTKDGPELQVQSWGAYHKVNWSNIQDNWRRGYGGPYPHVVCDEASPLMKKGK